MRYLGLDLGSKTLGLAISEGIIASSYDIIRFKDENYQSLIPILKDIIVKEKIEVIVLGFPKNMNNSIGERANIALSFKELLEKEVDIKIFLQDERLSTKAAHSYMIESNLSREKRKKHIDSLAAQIILQTYLNGKE